MGFSGTILIGSHTCQVHLCGSSYSMECYAVPITVVVKLMFMCVLLWKLVGI